VQSKAGEDIEEECTATFTPVAILSEVETDTGEKDEEAMFSE
jgi:hypothetical protein